MGRWMGQVPPAEQWPEQRVMLTGTGQQRHVQPQTRPWCPRAGAAMPLRALRRRLVLG